MRRSLQSWPYAFAIVGVLALLAVFARGFLPTTAQDNGATDDPAPRVAMLGTGTCDALDASEYEIDDQGGMIDGERAGAAEAAVVTYSLLEIPASLDDLIAAPHAVAVTSGSEDLTDWVACGEIGGFVDVDGVAVGLRPPDGAGLAGIAILWDDGDSVEVELYLAEDVAQDATPPAA